MPRRAETFAICFLLLSGIDISLAEEGTPKKPSRLAEGIQDNSFFIEEAYNQERGVVQHILNVTYAVNHRPGPDEKEWAFTFTQEWPLGSQKHQLSFTAPYAFLEADGEEHNGVGDVLLNYRFQLTEETADIPAIAPRASLILPTGDEDRGLGDGVLGFQFNLPVSKVVADRWSVHANAGLTFLPDVQESDLVNYNLGGSVIFAASRTFNLMLECLAAFEEEPDSGHRSSVIISPGFRYAFNFKNEAQMVVGLAAPIGVSSAAPDYGVFAYFSFEHLFARRPE